MDVDPAYFEGAQPKTFLKALVKASAVSYPHSKAMSVTGISSFASRSAAADSRRKRIYSPTEYPVTALKIWLKVDGA